MNTNAYVILPNTNKDFLANGVNYGKDGKLKVVWLLHGMGDDYTGWIRFTNLERYALNRGIAVVCPSAIPQSFYTDMVKGLSYFSYISEELPKFMQETFPQFSSAREDNYIGGLSMGGYGALKIGLSCPENYSKIGCLSAGNLIEMALPEDTGEDNFMTPFFGVGRNAFGVDNMSDALNTKDDVKYLFDKAMAENKNIPDIFMYCGTEDFVKAISDSTAEHIQKGLNGKAKFEYKTGSGMHCWEFWDAYLPVMFDDFGLTSLM